MDEIVFCFIMTIIGALWFYFIPTIICFVAAVILTRKNKRRFRKVFKDMFAIGI